MRVFFDTEFIEDGTTIDLISIGMVREDGAVYYAEALECDLSKANDWVVESVVPHLHRGVYLKPRARIATDIIRFVGWKPEFWAYYCSYDWVALCQLYGRMVDLPEGWPRWCRDLMHLKERYPSRRIPPDPAGLHMALNDANWVKQAFYCLTKGKDTNE